ncbi:MAG: hypothetical protein N5P05_003594 [Chroococcopsis gigantea SAG 12.99]|jgi:predicted GNAT family N-acyltransferase|nr:hypothetical protein [Chroococcopsis gigantea SAG 12.99]
MVLKIEILNNQKHVRANFACGKDSLNNYIQTQASQDFKKHIATVHVLMDEPDMEILAYYTLSAYTVSLENLSQDFVKNLPRYPLLPATLLGRLAVDTKYKGRRYGELMLTDALKKSLEVSTTISSLAVIVQALDEEAVSFYKKYNFQQFKNNPFHLYLPMKSIKKLFSDESNLSSA